ncbi:protein phosphatase 1G-like, partial [Centruroides sculpturatus]|uniref:protein phosphatase 1G-like n=1 Tax=Centruroides sculpturatus TaxID=218467 RepID=UPI000C6CD9A1
DAHNCIPDYDDKTSFFAVYDGHGGAEVAKYCSLHLPEFLHSLPQYKNNIAQSLEDAFIEFDSLLTKPEVISELKQLSGSSDASDSEEDDTTVLNEEAEMPLEELLARYKSGGVPLKSSPHLEHLHNDKWRSLAYVAFPPKDTDQPTNLHNDKPKSPVLRAKQENSLKKSEHNLKEENSNEILINGESNCIKKTQEIINNNEENSEKNTESSGDDDDDASSKSHNRTKDKNDSITEHTRKEEEKLENIIDNSVSNDDVDKEKDVDIDKSNKLESSFEKGSTSNNSSNNRKKGPVVDLDESDTSDDDYGESDSFIEEDDTTVLNEEAEMPLEELLARYKSGGVPLKSSPHLEHLHNDKWRSLAYVAFPPKDTDQPTNLHNDKPKSPVLRAKQENSLKKSEHNLKEENSNEILINGESNCIKKTQEIINNNEENSEKNTESSGDDDDDASSKSHNRTKDKNDSITEHTRKEEEKLENIIDNSVSNDDVDKEKDVDIDKSNKLESSFEKGSTSNNSSNNRKKGPVVDLDESDTSDDDYGESDSSEIDEEEWKEEDEEEEEEEGGEEEEDDDDDEEDDEIEEGDLFPIGEKEEPGSDSGCTAVVAVIHGSQLYVANAGDSRCVVSRLGEAIEMSSDHKPEDELERKRIENAGGHVTIDGRVNGGLNLSRAIGDHSYKQNKNLSPKEQMITALPDVRTLTLDVNSDDFMVLACDGIWNFMSSQEVIDFIKDRLDSDIKLSTISEQLFDYCLAPDTLGDGTGCDNMTCIIVKFHKLDSTNDNMSSLKRSHSPVNESPKEGKKMKVEEETSI